MKGGANFYSMLILMGLVSTACSNLKTTPVVADSAVVSAVAVEADRAVAQSSEGTSFSRVSEGKTVRLERCGGSAKLLRIENVLTLQVRNANCSNLKTSKGNWKLNGTVQGERWTNVTFDEKIPGDRMVLIGSNAYIESNGGDGNGDYLTVKISAKRLTLNLTQATMTKELKLEHCNGSIKAAISNGKVTLKISNTGCSKFDIISNGGDNIKYEVKPIPEVSIEAGYSGSFTIPNKFYDAGLNGIVIRLFSPRLTEEQILIKFQAW